MKIVNQKLPRKIESEEQPSKRKKIERREKNFISFILANVRSLRNQLNAGRLCIELELNQPDLILVTETWLDDSTQEVIIPGYRSIARRDRQGAKIGGGVNIFARDGFWNVGLHTISVSSERAWVTLHTSTGPILVGVWYRPPDEEREELQVLEQEIAKFSEGHIGCIICCDANVHHKRWLRFSDSNTGLGQDLQDICDGAGLTQIVREPTRKKNLLDLVLTTMPETSRATVLASVSDHRAVLVEVSLEVPKSIEVEREVWCFRKADWSGLKTALKNHPWHRLEGLGIDDRAHQLTNEIIDISKRFIPKRTLKSQKSTHPWLNERCREAARAKSEIEAGLLKLLQESPSHTTQEIELKLEDAVKIVTA